MRDGFTVTAPAVLGPAFWGWLAAQGEKVTLLSPTWAVRVWEGFARALDLGMGAKTRGGEIVQHALAPDLTPYCLRHTFCTDLQRAGVPINVAKELMGHANISVTANIYTHRDQKVLHSNMAKLAPRGRRAAVKGYARPADGPVEDGGESAYPGAGARLADV